MDFNDIHFIHTRASIDVNIYIYPYDIAIRDFLIKFRVGQK
jgi:hypothetical protein